MNDPFFFGRIRGSKGGRRSGGIFGRIFRRRRGRKGKHGGKSEGEFGQHFASLGGLERLTGLGGHGQEGNNKRYSNYNWYGNYYWYGNYNRYSNYDRYGNYHPHDDMINKILKFFFFQNTSFGVALLEIKLNVK